jgi:hypothetical protein
MARGWESKSVEEQMASALQEPEVARDDGFINEDARRLAEHVRTDRAREVQALNLQRENILSQKTSHPARRAALKAALAQVDGQIAHLG